ncbi:transposase (plasmid) [Streptomyces goshikiensis]|uniref:NF041680 family putative transposase n=1 Tax=Streptomyces goshikiensis TaxID=1942 RepID=UPI002F911599|nr:transposase [Streptomyces goshikiensis]
MGLVEHEIQRDAFTVVAEFRSELYACLTARSDALFELCDALLCTDGPVRTRVDLALAPEHRRGHGALYSGINHGRIDLALLRRALTSVPLPRAGDGRLVLAVDVSPWLRPDADTSSDRSFCHTFGRGLGKHQMVPGWPYSIVAALETGRTSWTALLDAIRLDPGADLAAVTASQVRDVIQRLVDAGQWRDGDPAVLVVLDAGYDAPRIAHLLADLPVEVLGRLRSNRVMRKPVPVPWICPPRGGRPPKHGGEFIFGRPETWGEATAATVTNTDRYGTATAQAWDRLHPRLTRRAAWLDHEGPLPIIEGTVIRLAVAKLPSGGVNKPVWLWWSGTGGRPADVDRCWQAFLRRFDVEHTFRLLKQTLGWTRLRDSAAADRWTWLVLAAHAQLRLARPLARDLRRPWERPAEPNRLTPARVRRGFRNLHAKTGTPAGAPKPTRPGPGRPVGSKNRQPANRYDVGRVLATGEPYARPAHHKKGTKPRRGSSPATPVHPHDPDDVG